MSSFPIDPLALIEKPLQKPNRPYFSSGPCVKYPGWSLADLQKAPVARSHRSTEGKALLQEIISQTRSILSIPEDYRVAIVPGSTTGAVEMALWSLLGKQGVDVFYWDIFGRLWADDIRNQLRLSDARYFEAPFGELPDFSLSDPKHDQVFLWCGTTAGVWLPCANWIPNDREGLTLCDATSAIFAVDLPWEKLDVVSFSWQKGLGGEAAHGMLVLSPRAVQRLHAHKPPWPVPRLFQMMRGETLLEGLFKGETLNTPSLLCAQDCLNALNWVSSNGGMPEMIRRTHQNFQKVVDWIQKTPWMALMATRPEIAAKAPVCLKITDPAFQHLSTPHQWEFLRAMSASLEKEEAAFEIRNHAFAPPSLRIWCGPMVEGRDLELLFPWLEWAFQKAKKDFVQEALL